MSYLNLVELSKTFEGKSGQDHLAVDAINLDIEKGELLTLLGPSGCGKTTILRMIAGFEFPTSGEIILNGVNIANYPPNKRNIAMVFQHYALFPHLSVMNNLAFGLVVKKYKRKDIQTKVNDILERIGLKDLGHRMPHELSGGQQQRVALARSLVVEPKMLLCDEPLSNLDAALRVQMRHEIRKIHKEFGITTVYVTHDHEEAMVLSDRIVLLNKGRIEQSGIPCDFYRVPKSRFVKEFFGNAKLVSGNIKGSNMDISQQEISIPINPAEYKEGSASLVLRPDEVTIIEG